MKQNAPPDMRLFEAVRDDHRLYDAYLTELFEPYSHWTRANVTGKNPLTIAHYREDARLRFASLLAKSSGQNESSLRTSILPIHLAHEAITCGGIITHAKQAPDAMRITALHVRSRLIVAISHKQLPIVDPDHPLMQHYKCKHNSLALSINGKSKNASCLPLHQTDIACARHIVGNHPNE